MGTSKYLKAYFFSLDIAFLSKGTRQIRHRRTNEALKHYKPHLAATPL